MDKLEPLVRLWYTKVELECKMTAKEIKKWTPFLWQSQQPPPPGWWKDVKIYSEYQEKWTEREGFVLFPSKSQSANNDSYFLSDEKTSHLGVVSSDGLVRRERWFLAHDDKQCQVPTSESHKTNPGRWGRDCLKAYCFSNQITAGSVLFPHKYKKKINKKRQRASINPELVIHFALF